MRPHQARALQSLLDKRPPLVCIHNAFAGQSSQQPWESVLDEMIAAGYVGTELGPYGFLPTDPNALKAALAARGLQLLSAFVPVQLSDWSAHEAGLAACAKRSARREPGNMSS